MQSDRPNILVVFLAFIALSGTVLVALAVPRSDFVVVIATPGVSEASMMRLISDAGGTFVTQGSADWIAVAHAEGTGFVSRLFGAGALLVLDHSLAFGCLERK